jgi:hypothetical protein
MPMLAPLTKPLMLPAPARPDNGWSATGDIVVRFVADEASGTRIKNIFDFAAGQLITELESNGNATHVTVTPLSAASPDFIAQAEQHRPVKTRPPGLM